MPRALLILLVIAHLSAHSQVPDSLQLPLDSLVQAKLELLDSIHQQTEAQLQRLKQEYDSVNAGLTLYQQKLQLTIDSLNRVGLPAERMVQKLDSVNQLKGEKLAAIQSAAEELKRKTIGRIEALELPDELKASIEQYTGTLGNLDITLPSTEFSIPSLQLRELPAFSLHGLKGIPSGISDLSLPQIGRELGEVMNNIKSVQQAIPETPTVEAVAAEAEEHAGRFIADQFGELPNLPELPSEEEAKEAMIKEAKKQVVNHFAGKEQQLQSAMENVNKYKQTFSDVQSIKDLPKKAPNPMKDKPLRERLVPGVSLQVQRRNEWWFDVNSYMGYRFSKHFTAGLGWNQRIAYDFNTGKFNSSAKVYGLRSYGEYRLNKGILPRLELECLNTPIRNLPDQTYTTREWVWSAMAGLKKEYEISKSLRGNAQVLYNMFDPEHRSPYLDRLNVRMGVEYSIPKPKRKP